MDVVSSRVWFGGDCVEHWTSDYRLYVSYHDRRLVTAEKKNGRWTPSGGDGEYLSLLGSPDCPEFSQRYFSAAAEVYAAAQACLGSGRELGRLYECFTAPADPIAAAELLRLMMDDCAYPIEQALPTVLRCCARYAADDREIEALRPLQPRTAQVARVLREQAAWLPCAVHDSRMPEYRRPFGTLRCGEELRLGFRLLGGAVVRAELLVKGDALERRCEMHREGDRFFVSLTAPAEPAALWYVFRLETTQGERWLGPDAGGYNGVLSAEEPEGFRLTVFRRDFETPAWFRGSVMYQVFPDRFAFSDDGTAERGIAYHRALGQSPELHESLDEPVRYRPRSFEKDYSPDDFYGGTLKGIEEKLPYLKELGIGCLYLNPIVEARSNHRYDTSDYLKTDPILGSVEDFTRLCGKAEALGIRVMLDGVYSHTGADSLYFNRYGNYPGPGACQSRESPYYPWYDFSSYPDKYRCWWGFQDLPEVDERNAAWQDFVVTGQDSVIRQWLRRGACGWRLDVADELPDGVLAMIRRAAKEEKPDALILGEVWEDAVVKESYGSRRRYALGDALDSVMNYPLRAMLLDFIHHRADAFALRDFLIGQQMNYPRPLYYSLMNLLGSHDTDRILTAMATPVVLRGLSREAQLALPFGEKDKVLAPEREMLCAALQFALPGVPSIYYGDEQGMWGVGDPFNRQPFREGEGELHKYYVNLSARRNSSDALKTGEAVFDACSSDVLTVLRYVNDQRDALGLPAENGAWLLALNRGDAPADFSADASAAGCGTVSGMLDAREARWLRLK